METPTCTAAIPRKLPALTLQPGDVVELHGLEWELVERLPGQGRPPWEKWYARPVSWNYDVDDNRADAVPLTIHPANLLRYTIAEVS